MEFLLILLLPVLWVWLEYFNKRAQDKVELIQAKKEMWRQERIDQLWEKELKLRGRLYEEIFGEEHEFSIELKKKARKAWGKRLIVLMNLLFLVLIFLIIVNS